MDSRLSASPYLRACRGEATEHTPVWLNRQAGRYMPEYPALKGKTPSLEFFKNPELAAQATLDAQRILGVDAAIMFADLLPMLGPMGLELGIHPYTRLCSVSVVSCVLAYTGAACAANPQRRRNS